MKDNEKILLDRRKILMAALAGGGSAAIAACGQTDEAAGPDHNDLWSGFDDRITERTLAEAEKLFGLQFSESERRLIIGGPVDHPDEGFFC